MDPCPKCGSNRTKDMDRTGGGAAGENEQLEVNEDHEWMKCADCQTLSSRPLTGGEWEPISSASGS
jgi:hypothetical protein